MSKISFIYFDVGGVVIKDFSDTNKWQVMMEKMGVDPQNYDLFDQIYGKYENDICAGKMTIDDLIPVITEQIKLTTPIDFSWLRYFVDNFEKNEGIWKNIELAKSKAKIGLLTGQYPGMLNMIKEYGLLPNIIWDQIVDSSVVGFNKPMIELYQKAQKLVDLPGKDILFIDNREKNLVPVRALDWQTFLYDSSNYDKANRDLVEYLKNIL